MATRIIAVIAAAVLFAALPASEYADAQTASAQTHVVTIKDFAYSPNPLTIAVGDSVKFVNDDDVAHTATAGDGSFDSKEIDNGKSWTYTFSTAGTYPYICSVHPSMTGKIIVQ